MTAERARPRRGATVAAFLLGLPLGIGVLALVHVGPLRDTVIERYLRHEVEAVEVILFAVAFAALGVKLVACLRERFAALPDLLPPWNGTPVDAREASRLLGTVAGRSRLAHRAAAALGFVARRGSAADLDDHLRDLADADRDAVEESYALVRFITWAIPILGFLGTVLGITGAIAGVTPERLETDLNSVTDGLALAFDSTALALGLTMVAMFLTYVVERLEGGVLDGVDEFVDRQLAHRFVRAAAESSAAAEAVVRTTEALVQRQADVWAQALAEIERRRAAFDAEQQRGVAAALEAALERTLRIHGERVAAVERQAVEAVEGAASAVSALAQAAEAIRHQSAVLVKLQEDETNLLRLQETLARNLDALSHIGTFEEAVHSLTAAAHLLTARAAATPVRRPGAAA